MRLGVIDVGSNTVHLLLLDVYPGSRPEPYASHKTPLRLVQHLDAEGRITDTGRDVLTRFVIEARDVAAQAGADDLLAFATSAIREARNGGEVLEHVQTRSGVRLAEISGDQEAAVTFFAVRRWVGWGAGTVLDLDIGGGSFELAAGLDGLPQAAISVPLGAARMTRRYLHDDPALPEQTKRLRKHAKRMLMEAVGPLQDLGRPDLVVGTSKTFRTLARICGAAPSGAGPYVTRTLPREDLRLWTRRMEAMDEPERAQLPGVSADRARQILGGAIVAETALDVLDVESMQICPWALREGIILRRLDRLSADPETPLYPPHALTGQE